VRLYHDEIKFVKNKQISICVTATNKKNKNTNTILSPPRANVRWKLTAQMKLAVRYTIRYIVLDGKRI